MRGPGRRKRRGAGKWAVYGRGEVQRFMIGGENRNSTTSDDRWISGATCGDDKQRGREQGTRQRRGAIIIN